MLHWKLKITLNLGKYFCECDTYNETEWVLLWCTPKSTNYHKQNSPISHTQVWKFGFSNLIIARTRGLFDLVLFYSLGKLFYKSTLKIACTKKVKKKMFDYSVLKVYRRDFSIISNRLKNQVTLPSFKQEN
jgi:hypothetical protein